MYMNLGINFCLKACGDQVTCVVKSSLWDSGEGDIENMYQSPDHSATLPVLSTVAAIGWKH